MYGTRVVLLLPSRHAALAPFLLHKCNTLITLFAVLISVWLLRVAGSSLTAFQHAHLSEHDSINDLAVRAVSV
jgi:hypothetical protein